MIPYSNRIWPTAVAGEADSVSSLSASVCHIGGTNSVNPGQILLVYGTNQMAFLMPFKDMEMQFRVPSYAYIKKS